MYYRFKQNIQNKKMNMERLFEEIKLKITGNYNSAVLVEKDKQMLFANTNNKRQPKVWVTMFQAEDKENQLEFRMVHNEAKGGKEKLIGNFIGYMTNILNEEIVLFKFMNLFLSENQDIDWSNPLNIASELEKS